MFKVRFKSLVLEDGKLWRIYFNVKFVHIKMQDILFEDSYIFPKVSSVVIVKVCFFQIF